MVESSFGWDARCSCGWETRSGGFIANRIREAIAEHKFDVPIHGESSSFADRKAINLPDES